MSRFTVGQEITPKETGEFFTYGKFYRVAGIECGEAVVIADDRRLRVMMSDFALTREEYEQAEREKDPFAPGKWVVCVRDDWPVKVGYIIQVLEVSDILGCFRVRDAMSPSGYEFYLKSYFRPATPEEIKEQEKIMDEKMVNEAEVSRQTFTVGRREFYVGQTVWANRDIRSIKRHDRLEIVGNRKYEDISVGVRTFGTTEITFVDINAITTTPPKPHEWKFGDWARHPECGVLFVTGIGDEDEDGDREIEVLMKDGTAVVLGDFELTYISTAEIPE